MYNDNNQYNGMAQLFSGSPLGEYVNYEFPYSILPSSFSLTPGELETSPRTFKIYATLDDDSWTLISQHTNYLFTNSNEEVTFELTEDVTGFKYNKFSIIVEKIPEQITGVIQILSCSIKKFTVNQHVVYEKLDKNLDNYIVDLRIDNNTSTTFRQALHIKYSDETDDDFYYESGAGIEINGRVISSNISTAGKNINIDGGVISACDDRNVRIGEDAGDGSTSVEGIAIGYGSGTNQGASAISIGVNAGGSDSSNGSTTVGNNHTIALGTNAQYINAGAYSIAIGMNAGVDTQHTNSVIISGGSTILDSVTSREETMSMNSFAKSEVRLSMEDIQTNQSLS
jgi:hypothetical protein